MQEYFYALADAITASLHADEFYTCTFQAEDSDFVRFNRSAIRQAGTVVQRFLTLDLIRGQRHAAAEIALAGDVDSDRARVSQMLIDLREKLPYLPEDPHLLYATTVHSSVQQAENRLPPRDEMRRDPASCGQGPGSSGLLRGRRHLRRLRQCAWPAELVCKFYL